MKKKYSARMDYPLEEIAPNVYKISDFNVTNCYLVVGKSRAILIDCGTGFGDLRGFIKTITPLPVHVVATHIHPDHTGGMGQFESIYVHRDDIKWSNYFMTSLWLRKIIKIASFNTVDKTIRTGDIQKAVFRTKILPIDDGHIFDLGDRKLQVIHSPGHTRGSIILLDEVSKILFLGDNMCPSLWLFLPGALSVEEWLVSAGTIAKLSEKYTPYWGHEEGKLDLSLIERVIQFGKEITAKHEKNSKISLIKAHPFNDRVNGSIVYRTGNVFRN